MLLLSVVLCDIIYRIVFFLNVLCLAFQFLQKKNRIECKAIVSILFSQCNHINLIINL